MRKCKLWLAGLLCIHFAQAQETFPVNGVADQRNGSYAFTHATIVKNSSATIGDATLLIRDGKITAVIAELAPGGVLPRLLAQLGVQR